MPKPVVKEQGFLDKLLSPLWLGAIGAAIMGLVAWVFFSRRRKIEEEFNDIAMAPGAAAVDSIENDSYDSEVDSSQAYNDDDGFVEQDDAPVEAEMGDPIAEADIYVAYGRYPQAVELLNHAIEQEPNRADLVAKLVEVHTASGDGDAAAVQSVKLEALGGIEAVAGGDVEHIDENVFDALPDVLDDAPDVMDEFRDSLPEGDTSMDFSDEFNADEFNDSNDEKTGIMGGVVAGAIGLAAAGAASVEVLGDKVDDLFTADNDAVDVKPDDGLDLSDDFDLELSLDDDDFDLGDSVESLDDGSDSSGEDFTAEFSADLNLDSQELDSKAVREAFAAGNTLQNETVFSEAALLDDDLSDEFDVDLGAGSEALGEQIESVQLGGDVSVLDELSDFDVPMTADDDIDIENELSSLDASMGYDFAANDLLTAPEIDLSEADVASSAELSTDFSELEAELEESGLGDDPVQRSADIAMLETDETATKLDLARAYIDMGDNDGARDILDEVLKEGSALDKQQAKELTDRLN